MTSWFGPGTEPINSPTRLADALRVNPQTPPLGLPDKIAYRLEKSLISDS